MLWKIFLSAIALMLVFEGIMPFLSPQKWRDTLGKLMEQSDQFVRIAGLISMLVGAVILFVLHGLN